MEIVIVGIILLFLFNYIGIYNFNKFVQDNKGLFTKLKEDDYDFFLVAKHGEGVDCDAAYQKRVKQALFIFILGMLVIITSFTTIKFVIVLGITYIVFKSEYNQVKK